MNDLKQYLVIDYETRSECDLRKCGPWEYSVHPSTRILCVAWRIGTRESLRAAPVRVWSPFIDPTPPGDLLDALLTPEVRIVAHNAGFEQVITRNVLMPHKGNFSPHRWQCTAAMAAALALPRKLEDACIVLKLPVTKDMDGHRLMLKM